MRTTLEIDDDVLQAAKELAAAEKKTAGRILSDLARKALTAPETSGNLEVVDGIPIMRSRGVVVTKELVDKLIEQTELEDGVLSLRQ